MFRIKIIISATILFLINACDNIDKKLKTKDVLYYADIEKDLSRYLTDYSYNKLNSYYLEDSLVDKDSIKRIKYYYSILLLDKNKTLDSLGLLLPEVFWLDKNYKPDFDSMTYVNSVNVVKGDAEINESVRKRALSYVEIFSKMQTDIIDLRLEMEKLRPGKKNEKINCLVCKELISPDGIKQAKTMAQLYLETEKQFVIIFRELGCATYAIELIDQRKVATNSHKIRI
ncbi:MAG: hypothetical protein K0R24_2460 [Gammaproteobacteria bacterium]|jgi:hypothetical protein|nr:hypothetical protein [Gammaproteobacteria bacterium]